MAFVNALISQGWAVTGGGGVDGATSDSIQDLLTSAASDVEKMWRCWLSAEAERNAGNLDQSMLWLQASEEAADAAGRPAVWVAEYDTTAGRALHRSGDPEQALPFLLQAHEHWHDIVELMAHGTPDSTGQLLESVYEFLGILFTRSDGKVDPRSDEATSTWVSDRATSGLMASASECIYLCAAGRPEVGRQIGDDLLAFLPSITTSEGRKILESDVRLALGNLEQANEQFTAAIHHLDIALATLRPVAGDPVADDRVTRLELSRANALVRLGRFDEAMETYDQVISALVARGDRAAELRARFSRLLASRQAGETTQLVPRLREVLTDYADFAGTCSPDELRDAAANRQAAYALLLVTLAGEHPTSPGVVDELVQVVGSLRGNRLLAQVEMSGIEGAAPLISPLRLLDRRLARLPDTALLVWQPAVDGIVLMVLTSGTEPLEERIIVTTAGQDLADAATEAIDAAGDAGRVLLSGSSSATDLDQTRMKQAGERLAGALPPDVAAALGAATTVIISPSADGTSEKVPFELMRVDGEYLAIRRVVTRSPSLDQLVAMLAPNRRCRTSTTGAAVLRAQDPPRPDSPATADDDPVLDERLQLRTLGLDPQLETMPTATQTLDLLDSDLRLLHYVGHSRAARADRAAADDGEVLVLGEHEALPATQLSTLSGARTPFVVLSGGGQRGFGMALLERGAPAVVATSFAVPDHLCAGFTQALYRAAGRAPAGEALRLARQEQSDQGLHPVAWSSFTLHGDPWASLVDVAPPAGSARFTQDWPAWLTRWLATGREEDRSECLRTLSEALDALPELAEVITLIDHRERAVGGDAEALASRISDVDAEGGAALGILIAVERLRALTEGDTPPDDTEALQRKEIGAALMLALQLDDAYAFLLLAGYHGGLLPVTESVRALEHAEGCADALADDATALAPLLQRLDAVSARGGSWSDWVLRYVGTDTQKALSAVMSAIRGERYAGTISPELADALWSLMKSFRAPGRCDEEALARARSTLSEEAVGLRTLEILDLFDRIFGAGKNIDPQDVEDGLRLAYESGHEGATARFLLLSAQVAFTGNDIGAARDRTMQALELLDHLRTADEEYAALTTSAASNARYFSDMLGETEAARAIEHQYL